MSFPDDSPKKMKQGLLIPLDEGLSKDLCEDRGSRSSLSEHRATKKRNRLRLHDRKSVNDKDGWGEQGGYMNAKKQKLANQFKSKKYREIFNAGESTNIFQGVSIYVNGYTKPSSDELKRLMMLHGGRYEMYLSKQRVTHIIATNLCGSKITSLHNYKVVHPDWILKSIEAGHLLSYTSFQLFTTQSKLQKGIMQFSVEADKTQNLRTTFNKTYSSLSFPTDRNNFQTKNTVSSTIFEKEACESTISDFLDSPQSCNSDDLFLSSVDESSQESKKSKKSQESSRGNHANSSPPEPVPSTNKASLNSDFNLNPEKALRPSLLEDNDEMLASPLEMKVEEPLSFTNAVENKEEISTSNATQHKTMTAEEYQDKPMQEKVKNEIAQESSKKAPQININYKSSISTSNNKPKLTSVPVSLPKIVSGVPNSKSNSLSAKTAQEPNYLNQFYNNSRLHHLSTWKVEWKNYVSDIKACHKNNFPGREKLMSSSAVTKINSKTDISASHRTIMHIDMDSFFVSVALKDKPELKDKPVAVTHSQKKGPSSNRAGVDVDYERQQWIKRRQECALKGKVFASDVNAIETTFDSGEEDLDNDTDKISIVNQTCHAVDQKHEDSSSLNIKSEKQVHQSFSEIASCNYVARKAGLKNGMFIGDALKLCPNLITLPYEFDKYQEVSKILYDTVTSYTHDVEAVSCDEMLVDCTSLLQETGVDVHKFVTLLRQEIFEKTECTASAGLGPNILLARLATHKAKPNGHFLVQHDQTGDFIKAQATANIPGVGRATMYKLEHLHVKTCGDLQKLSLSTLQQHFGLKTGQILYNYCRGKDDRSLQMEYNQKSVSAEINYGIRFKNDTDMNDFLNNLSSEVESRLKKANKRGKTITLKLMVRRPDAPLESAKYMGHGLCNNMCKSVTLAMATDQASVISKKCMLMYKALKLTASDLRGIGISIHRLESSLNVEPGGSFVSSHQKSYTILKFAKTITQEAHESPPSPPSSNSSNLNESSPLINDTKAEQVDFHPMKAIHVQQFGTINFMEELKRQGKSSGKLPPLPHLPSHLQSLKLPAPKPESEDFLPSPSQVDDEVLNELPADIRHQIQVALKQKQKKKSLKSGNLPPIQPIDSNQPGCSHWTPSNPSDFVHEELEARVEEVNNPTAHNISDIERELLPNLSQVDENCLNELPEDIQQEMRTAMKQREICKQDEAIALSAAKGSSSASSPLKMMVLLSPTKDSSPGKSRGVGQKRKSPLKSKKSPGKKRSPHFKVPRGRPRTKRGIGSRTVLDARKKLFLYGDIDKKYSEKKPPVLPSPQPPDSPPSHTSTTINLCGAVTISEIRELLREWLTTCSDPTVDDELFVIDYLKALVQDKNLEQVDLVLKFLYRNISRLNAENWLVSLRNIVETVQKAVMAQYKSRLKLGFSLPTT